MLNKPEKPKPEHFGLSSERIRYFESTKSHDEGLYINIGLFAGLLIGVTILREEGFFIILICSVLGAFIGYKLAHHLDKEAEKNKKQQHDYQNYLKYSEALNKHYYEESKPLEGSGRPLKQPSAPLRDLPEGYSIDLSSFHEGIKIENPAELERFHQYSHLIHEEAIKRNYIDIENEAVSYFRQNNLIAMRSCVPYGEKLINIFYLTNYLDKNNEVLTAQKSHSYEIQIIRSCVKQNDIQQFSKYIIGIPDIFVINQNIKVYFFCEVKSIYDRLQNTQKLWFLKNFIDYKPNAKYQILRIHPIERFKTLKTYVAGLRYLCSSNYLETLKQGDKFFLQRDKNNPHDEYAVKVIHIYDHKHIGFVPRVFNREENIWQMIDQRRFIDCFIEDIKRNPPNYLNSHNVKIQMKFKE